MPRLFFIREDAEDIFYIFNEQNKHRVMYASEGVDDFLDTAEEIAALADIQLINLRDVVPEGCIPHFRNADTGDYIHDDDDTHKKFVRTVSYYVKHYDTLKLLGV